MVEKKKLVPELRFPEFDGEWEVKSFGDISSDCSYGMNSAAIDYDGIHKYIRITDIDESSNNYKPSPLCSPDGVIDDKYKLKVGDILFTRTGASTGKTYLYKSYDGNLYYAGFLIKFSFGESAKFVFYNTQLEYYRKWVLKTSMRSGQPGINSQEYKSFKLPLPTLSEQQKIADFLSAVDQRIQLLQKKKEHLETYKKGVMQQIFSQKIRFKDENGENYPDWEEKKLGEVVNVVMGQSPNSNSYNSLNQGIPLIQGNADLSDGIIRPRQWTSDPTKFCEPGDLILTVRAPVGLVAKSNIRACIGRGVCSLKSKHNNSSEYLYHFLSTMDKEWLKIGQGSTFTAVSSTDIQHLYFNHPSLPEQQKIAEFLSSIDASIDQLTSQIESTQAFKKGLLQKMFV